VISRITITAIPMHVKATAPRCSSRIMQATSSSFAHAFRKPRPTRRALLFWLCEDPFGAKDLSVAWPGLFAWMSPPRSHKWVSLGSASRTSPWPLDGTRTSEPTSSTLCLKWLRTIPPEQRENDILPLQLRSVKEPGEPVNEC
jgi:hypothetical protein